MRLHEQLERHVASNTYHDVNLFLDIIQHCLIGNSDSLQNMMGRIEDGLRRPNKIDVSKATYVSPVSRCLAVARKLLRTLA